MAGEIQAVWGNVKTLEAAGASITSGNMSLASTNGYGVEVDGNSYPDVQFIIGVTFNVAPIENAAIAIFAQVTGLDGVDADAPKTTRPVKLLGTVSVNNVTTPQSLELVVTDVPRNAKYFLQNVNAGQAVASWTLKAVPKTYKTAA